MSGTNQIPDLLEILSRADEADLKLFLKKYASRNLTLEVRLRTYLIRETESPAGTNKYSQILGLLIKHNVHGTIRLTKRTVQLVAEVAHQFADLQETLLQEGELRDAWDCAEAVITQLHLFMDKYHGPEERLIEALTRTYASLQTLLLRTPAPELRDDIFKTLLALAHRNPHVLYDLNFNAIMTLAVSEPGSQYRKKIQERVLEKVHDPGTLNHLQWKTWCAMLAKIPWSDTHLMQEIPARHIYDVAHLMNAERDRPALRRLIEQVPVPDVLGIPQQTQWVRWKFEFAEQNRSLQDILPIARDLIALDPTIATYTRVRETVSFDLLRQFLSSTELPAAFLADAYAMEESWKDVFEIVHHARDLDMLIAHTPGLLEHIPDYPKAALEIVLDYASHHGGTVCVERVETLLRVLAHEGAADIGAQLLKDVKAHFPDRFDGLKAPRSKGVSRISFQFP